MAPVKLYLIKQIEEETTAMNVFKVAMCGICVALLTACAPEVGSEAWCEDLKQKPKGEWTANEATDFAKHCIFK